MVTLRRKTLLFNCTENLSSMRLWIHIIFSLSIDNLDFALVQCWCYSSGCKTVICSVCWVWLIIIINGIHLQLWNNLDASAQRNQKLWFIHDNTNNTFYMKKYERFFVDVGKFSKRRKCSHESHFSSVKISTKICQHWLWVFPSDPTKLSFKAFNLRFVTTKQQQIHTYYTHWVCR